MGSYGFVCVLKYYISTRCSNRRGYRGALALCDRVQPTRAVVKASE